MARLQFPKKLIWMVLQGANVGGFPRGRVKGHQAQQVAGALYADLERLANLALQVINGILVLGQKPVEPNGARHFGGIEAQLSTMHVLLMLRGGTSDVHKQ